MSIETECLDCPGKCFCNKKLEKMEQQKKGFISCALDLPNFDKSVEFDGCEASHEQKDWPCRHAIDGKDEEHLNGWAYSGKVPAWIKLTLKHKETAYISKVRIRTSYKFKSHHLKTFRIRLNEAGVGWIVPKNMKVTVKEGNTVDVYDGYITSLQEIVNFKIEFDPIDAWQVLIDVFSSWNGNTNVIINEITLYKAGNGKHK